VLCAIPIVREVVQTDVNVNMTRMRPSAVRARRSWAIAGRRSQDIPAQLVKRLATLRHDGDVAV